MPSSDAVGCVPPSHTLDALADRDLAANNIEAFIKNWLLPTFGHRTISAITRADVVALLAELKASAITPHKKKKGEKRTLSSAYRVNIFQTLRRVFRYAIANGIFPGPNPCDLIDMSSPARPRVDTDEKPVLSRVQAGSHGSSASRCA